MESRHCIAPGLSNLQPGISSPRQGWASHSQSLGSPQSALRGVHQSIRDGTSLSDALAQHPEQFPELYVASVKAGEQVGSLPEVLQRYIVYLKLVIGVRQKMTKAMAYPAFLIVVGVVVVGFLVGYILPTFAVIYGDTLADLPPATRTLIGLVQNIQSHFLIL
ncbi:MAG: hypothetical protein E6K67_05285, partial [Nitrospirae bacterium]